MRRTFVGWSKGKNPWWWLIVWAIFLILWTVVSIWPAKLFLAWEKTEWIVVDTEIHHDSDGTTYSPVVRYTCWWKTVTNSTSSSSSMRYREWSSITIFCDANNPNDFAIYGDMLIFLFPLVGLLVIILISNSLITEKRKRNYEIEEREENSFVIEESKRSFSSMSTWISSSNNNFVTIMMLWFGTLVFWIVWCMVIYSSFSGAFNAGTLFWGAIFLLSAWLIGRWLINEISKNVRIKVSDKMVKDWSMVCQPAKVIGFAMRSQTPNAIYYEIMASDWESVFNSDSVAWTVYWFDEGIFHFLNGLKITYDPTNPQKTLDELRNTQYYKQEFLNYSWDEDYKKQWLRAMLKQSAYNMCQQAESYLESQIEGWEKNKAYWLFNGRKICVWDSINVYINPENKKRYLVDLSSINI